jgi:periplasmic protein TonB
MFENLVESTSHKEDLRRKSVFILVTVVVYGVFFVGFLVAGIYWYDARLDNQTMELTTLVAPVPIPAQQNQPEQKQQKVEKVTQEKEVPMRTEFVARVDQPLPPKDIGIEKSKVPPVPPGGAVIGNRNIDPVNSGGPIGEGTGVGIPGGTGTGPPARVADEPPPPPPKPQVPKAPISGGVLNGKAISLPKPPYPAIARAAHASGTVTVQVTIDENGSVISAHAVGGHPLLQQAAVSAARQARFSPTKLSGQPVKVTGVITYNFVAQ